MGNGSVEVLPIPAPIYAATPRMAPAIGIRPIVRGSQLHGDMTKINKNLKTYALKTRPDQLGRMQRILE